MNNTAIVTWDGMPFTSGQFVELGRVEPTQTSRRRSVWHVLYKTLKEDHQTFGKSSYWLIDLGESAEMQSLDDWTD